MIWQPHACPLNLFNIVTLIVWQPHACSLNLFNIVTLFVWQPHACSLSLFIIFCWFVWQPHAKEKLFSLLRRSLGFFIISSLLKGKSWFVYSLRHVLRFIGLLYLTTACKNCSFYSKKILGLFIIFDNHMPVRLVSLRRKISWFIYYNWHSHACRCRVVVFLVTLLYLTFPRMLTQFFVYLS